MTGAGPAGSQTDGAVVSMTSSGSSAAAGPEGSCGRLNDALGI